MNVKTDVFPINYFKSIWTPLKAFSNRYNLSWLNIVVVLIFLNALMAIPVTINFAQVDSIPVENLYPNSANIIKNEQVETFNNLRVENGELQVNTFSIYENEYGIAAIGRNADGNEQVNQADNAVVFEENQFIIKEEGLPTSRVPYTENFALEQMNSSEDVLAMMSEQWFVQNQVFFVAVFTLIISVIQFVMLLFIVFGSALFLYLTKNSPITSIETYKESINLIVNAISLPTIIGILFGLVNYNIITIQMIQAIGLLIMLLIIYFKTQFNDELLYQKEIEKSA